MLIFCIFEQSIELEQALAELENSSISREHILIVFMDNNSKKSKFQEHSPHAFEIGISFATGAAVIGASCGFDLTLGPILCGLIGAFIGFSLGVSTYFLYNKMKSKSRQKKITYEVTVVIQCEEEQANYVSDILWKYQARSVGYKVP